MGEGSFLASLLPLRALIVGSYFSSLIQPSNFCVNETIPLFFE